MRRKIRAYLLAAIGVILVALAGVWGHCSINRLTATELDNLIKSNTPIGSDKAQVISFLDSLKSHSAIVSVDNGAGYLRAWISDVSWCSIVERGFSVIFYFDMEGRLDDYFIEQRDTFL